MLSTCMKGSGQEVNPIPTERSHQSMLCVEEEGVWGQGWDLRGGGVGGTPKTPPKLHQMQSKTSK